MTTGPIVWPFPSILKEHLIGPDILKIFDAVVRAGRCSADDASRLDFIAKAHQCATSPKVNNPGACFKSNVEKGIGYATDSDYRAARALIRKLFPVQPQAKVDVPVKPPCKPKPLPKPLPKPVAVLRDAVPEATKIQPRASPELVDLVEQKRREFTMSHGMAGTLDPSRLGPSLAAVLRLTETISAS